METYTEFAGAGLLGIALIVFWRTFAFVVRDRDYHRAQADYWRNEALGRKQALDDTLDAAEVFVKPLKKVERLVKKKMPPTVDEQSSNTEKLEAIVDILLRDGR